MSGRIIRSDLAIADLAEHAEYIRERRPRAAIRFLEAAELTLRQLATSPESFLGQVGQAFPEDGPIRGGDLDVPEAPEESMKRSTTASFWLRSLMHPKRK